MKRAIGAVALYAIATIVVIGLVTEGAVLIIRRLYGR